MDDTAATGTKLFQEATDAFVGFAAMQKELERVFNQLKSLNPMSEEYVLLDGKFNELHAKWRNAHQAFTEAEAKLSAFIQKTII